MRYVAFSTKIKCSAACLSSNRSHAAEKGVWFSSFIALFTGDRFVRANPAKKSVGHFPSQPSHFGTGRRYGPTPAPCHRLICRRSLPRKWLPMQSSFRRLEALPHFLPVHPRVRGSLLRLSARSWYWPGQRLENLFGHRRHIGIVTLDHA